MIFGAHESMAGGLHLAFERGKVDGARAIQIFTKNSNAWREPVLTDAQLEAFRAAHADFGRAPVMAHTSYLINLAADNAEVLVRSKDALVAEVQRCSALGIPYCVLHPGAHLGFGVEKGLARVVESLDEVHERTKGASARILIENTAGQGSCVGDRFEQIGVLFEGTREPERMGVCFDTQHAFAAGYDLSTADGYAKAWDAFEAAVGLQNLRAFHLNDSKKPLGARVDRHEHLGEGVIGMPLFWRLANDPRFADIPGVLETEPREGDAPFRDEVSLLTSLVGAKEPKPAAKPFALEIAPAPAKKKGKR